MPKQRTKSPNRKNVVNDHDTQNSGGRPLKGATKRDKKITLLITPELYDRIKESAFVHRNNSVNDYIFNLLDESIESAEELGL